MIKQLVKNINRVVNVFIRMTIDWTALNLSNRVSYDARDFLGKPGEIFILLWYPAPVEDFDEELRRPRLFVDSQEDDNKRPKDVRFTLSQCFDSQIEFLQQLKKPNEWSELYEEQRENLQGWADNLKKEAQRLDKYIEESDLKMKQLTTSEST